MTSTVCFNPRSRVGSDWPCFSAGGCSPCFNPRSRVGSDIPRPHHQASRQSFNPRSSVGSDDFAGPSGPLDGKFQSTLPRGERPGRRSGFAWCWCFNPRSRVGSDQKQILNAVNGGGVSIHAPAWGATQAWSRCFSPLRFQSTLPRGERLLPKFCLLKRAVPCCFPGIWRLRSAIGPASVLCVAVYSINSSISSCRCSAGKTMCAWGARKAVPGRRVVTV